MRTCIFAILACLALIVAPAMAQAQYPGIHQYGNHTWSSPYYVPAPYGYSSYYNAPGYRSYNNTQVVPAPWGSQVYNSYREQARPIYSAPFHSVYYDPFTRTYVYGSGYRNTPTYQYRYRYGF